MVLELDITTLLLMVPALVVSCLSVLYALGYALDDTWEQGREWSRVVSFGASVATGAVLVRSEMHALVLAAGLLSVAAFLTPRSSSRWRAANAVMSFGGCTSLIGWLVLRTQGGLNDPAVILASVMLSLGCVSLVVLGAGTGAVFTPVVRATLLKIARHNLGVLVAILVVPCLWLAVRPGGQRLLLSVGLVLGSLTVVKVTQLRTGQRVLPMLSIVALVASVSYIPAKAVDREYGGTQLGAVAASPYGEAFDKCALITTDYLGQKDCYSEYFVERTDELGVDGTLDLLVKVHQDNVNGRSFLNHCHEVLHDIAKSAAKKYGVEELFGSWVVTCTGGFAHGVLSEYVHGQSWDKVKEGFPTFCDNMTKKVVAAIVKKGKPEPSDNGWIDWNCNHMIGHIAYENNRDNVPETAKLCLSWPVGDTQWRNCGAGMFMEYYLDMTRNLNGVSLPQDPSDIHALCRQLDPDIQEPCYNESGAAVWQYNSGTAAGAFGLCKKLIPVGEMLEACYSGVSRMVTVANGFVPSKMNAACISGAEVDSVARDLCGNEVAGSLVMETNAPDEALNTCATVVVSEELNKKCVERVNSVSNQINGSGLGGGTGAVSE
jgi:hypothetical protein